MEDGGDPGVHLDHVVALLGHPLVAGVDLVRDPVLEPLAHDCVDHVGQVRPAELGDLLRRRQRVLDGLLALGEVEHGLDREALELGHVDDLDLVAGNNDLHRHGQVPQVEDGDGFVAGQVGPHLGGEEPVDL